MRAEHREIAEQVLPALYYQSGTEREALQLLLKVCELCYEGGVTDGIRRASEEIDKIKSRTG